MAGKTIIVNYFGRRGSGPEYALEMARGYKACGAQVYALLSADIDNLDRWLNSGFADVLTVRLSDHYKGAVSALARFYCKDLKRIRRYFSDKKIDALHVPMVHPLSVAVERIFRRQGVPTVFTLHDVRPHRGENNLHYLPIRLAARTLTRKASVIALLTEGFRDYVSHTYHRTPDALLTTPHALFGDYSEKANTKAQTPLADYNFLVFGRIVRYKGLDILAEAYRRVKQTYGSRISLRIVGSGDFEPYRSLYSDLEDVVVDNRFISESEVSGYFRMPRTIVLLPYTEASQSGVIPIAMSEGAQLVVTDFEGLLEQTDKGRSAIVCRPDAASLAEAMSKAVDCYDELEQMRIRAKKQISAITWEASAAKILKHLS